MPAPLSTLRPPEAVAVDPEVHVGAHRDGLRYDPPCQSEAMPCTARDLSGRGVNVDQRIFALDRLSHLSRDNEACAVVDGIVLTQPASAQFDDGQPAGHGVDGLDPTVCRCGDC